MPTTLTRRSFLGCSALSGTALALAPRLAFATSGSVDHTLVVLSLRGGLDGLSAVVPIEAGYYDRRPTIAVAEEALLPLDRGFGLHPSLAPLHDVWTDGRLSIVPGVGTPTGSRSHFQETDLIELGAGSLGQPRTTGWLGRHLLSRPQAPDGLPGVALSGSLPMSLAGFPAAAAVGNVGSFAVRGFDWRDRDRVHDTLRSLHEQGGDDLLAAQHWPRSTPSSSSRKPTRPPSSRATAPSTRSTTSAVGSGRSASWCVPTSASRSRRSIWAVGTPTVTWGPGTADG